MIDRFWHGIVAASAPRRAGLVFFLGLLAGLAFAPTYLIPLWPIGFGLTLGLIFQARTARMRLLLSFLFSYGYMLSGLYWIALAPTVDPRFYIAVPFALILLPALTAGFGTLALFLAGFWRQSPLQFGFFASALWMFFEWRRGIDLTGFAWNRAGMIWTADPLTMQLASVGGVPVLTACSVLIGVGFFLVTTRNQRIGWGFALTVPAFLLLFGAIRLAVTPIDSQTTIPDLNVRLVQANIPKNTWDGQFVFDQHVALSTRRSLDGISHVIWSEGSIRDHLDDNRQVRAYIGDVLAPAPHSLVFGRRAADVDLGRAGPAYLSAYLIDHATQDYAAYDKSNLVPFGEYLPLSSLLGSLGFSSITGGFINRIPGGGPVTLRAGNSPSVGVFICYDSLYTGQLVDQTDRPEWLATMTEDAWYLLPDVPLFAKTPGPYQHLAESRLRAVEEGLSIARVSNPGISVVIDSYGREWSHRLHLSTAGTLDSTIPKGLNATLYAALGPNSFYIMISFLFFIITIACRTFSRQNSLL